MGASLFGAFSDGGFDAAQTVRVTLLGSGFHLGTDKVTKSLAHQWIDETDKERFYQAVTSWPGMQASNVGRCCHRISDCMFDCRLGLGQFIILSNCLNTNAAAAPDNYSDALRAACASSSSRSSR
jgi:hypothetical protein